MLPTHGKMDCHRCFDSAAQQTCQPHPKWQMVNDPGHWGSATPEYLVLGFSKGATQTAAFRAASHEEVAFAKMRPRLGQLLETLGVLADAEAISTHIESPTSSVAFASLIRCSLTRINESESQKRGTTIYASSGNLIVKSFSEVPQVIERCTGAYLTDLPRTLKTAIFLGSANGYVKEVKQVVQRLYPDSYYEINPMAVCADGRSWVFVTHPSPANGTFDHWLSDAGEGGKKRRYAQAALKPVLKGHFVKHESRRVQHEEKEIMCQAATMNESFASGAGFTAMHADRLLREKCTFLGQTKYIAGFEMPSGKNLALALTVSGKVSVWIEYKKGKDPREVGAQVINRSNPGMPYGAQQPRNSGLNGTNAPHLRNGYAAWYVSVASEADLNRLLEWYV